MRFKALKHYAIQAFRRLLPGVVAIGAESRVELSWGQDKLLFENLSDFEFALGARTGVLPSRLHELMHRSAAELDAELQGIRNLDQRLGEILEASEKLQVPCGPAVAQLGVSVFSKDFDWRSLFTRLVELPLAADRHVRSAIAQYRQYLAARLATVRMVADLKTVAGDLDEAVEGHAKATVMFTNDGAMLPFNRDELRRLPQGEAVTLKLAPGSAISLKLARHQFSLAHNRGWTLVADNGKTYTLHAGVNCVGRGRDNDVSLDADFRNVSRKHLLAQPLDDDVIMLTDISSHGTYVPPTALAS